MAIQSRRGNKVNFDKDKMLPGEFGVALDSQEAFICFGAGIIKKMATDEDYADMMEECVTATENAQNVVDSFNNLEIEKLAIDDAKVSLITGWSSDKTSKHDTKDNVTTFTESTTIGNISSGEKHSVIFGKIRKLISSIKQVALTGSYTDLSNTPIVNCTVLPTASADTLGNIYRDGTGLKITLRNGNEGSYTYSWVPFISKDKVVNSFNVTEDGFVADARGLKTLKDGLDGVNNNLTALGTAIGSVGLSAKVDGYGWSYYTKIGRLIILYISFAPKSSLVNGDVIATLPFETSESLGNIAITGNNGNLLLAGVVGSTLIAQTGTTIATGEKVHVTISYRSK